MLHVHTVYIPIHVYICVCTYIVNVKPSDYGSVLITLTVFWFTWYTVQFMHNLCTIKAFLTFLNKLCIGQYFPYM